MVTCINAFLQYGCCTVAKQLPLLHDNTAFVIHLLYASTAITHTATSLYHCAHHTSYSGWDCMFHTPATAPGIQA